MLQSIQSADLSALLFIQDHLRNSAFTPLMRFFSFLGDSGWFWIALTLCLIIVPKTRKYGLLTAISLLIGLIVTNIVLKNAVARIRPYDVCEALTPLVRLPADFSFPSGHTTASFAASLVLAHYLPKKAGIPLVILAVLIALSRLYVGVHYPTDVLGGFLVGLFASQVTLRVIAPRIMNLLNNYQKS